MSTSSENNAVSLSKVIDYVKKFLAVRPERK